MFPVKYKNQTKASKPVDLLYSETVECFALDGFCVSATPKNVRFIFGEFGQKTLSISFCLRARPNDFWTSFPKSSPLFCRYASCTFPERKREYTASPTKASVTGLIVFAFFNCYVFRRKKQFKLRLFKLYYILPHFTRFYNCFDFNSAYYFKGLVGLPIFSRLHTKNNRRRRKNGIRKARCDTLRQESSFSSSILDRKTAFANY